jgi:hypothetical protein
MSHFPSFPPCCQKCLQELERDNRTGGRNCEKGHALSLDYAHTLEAANIRKAAEAAAKTTR